MALGFRGRRPDLKTPNPDAVLRNLRVLGSQALRRQEVERSFHGLHLRLLPGVFDPTLGEGSRLLADYLERESRGLRVLELGTGSGAAAIVAARSGARDVVATDVTRQALFTARRNIAAHGLDNRVRLVGSDRFSALFCAQLFDLVAWNPPFLPYELPIGRLKVTACDPHHDHLVSVLADLPKVLSPDGRFVFAFSELGNWPAVVDAARDLGRELRVIREIEDHHLSFWLAEVLPISIRDAEPSSDRRGRPVATVPLDAHR